VTARVVGQAVMGVCKGCGGSAGKCYASGRILFESVPLPRHRWCGLTAELDFGS
jgi:hypothetical protein